MFPSSQNALWEKKKWQQVMVPCPTMGMALQGGEGGGGQ